VTGAKASACLTKALARLTKALACLTKALACLTKAFACLSKAFACLTKAFACLTKAFACLFKASARLFKAFACLFKASACLFKASAYLTDASARFACAAVAVALAVLTLAACSDTVSHVFAGRQYDPDHHCIQPTTTIDVVSGNDPGAACPAVCLVSPPTQAGDRAIYVSKECPPYPPLFDLDGGTCAEALTTYAAATACGSDAGTD
jgi:hypothetical protein